MQNYECKIMNQKLRIKNQEIQPKGFSLVELTVAVAIFSMIIISAGSIFIQILKTQKEMLSKQILIDEGRYIMESMMKDIRMGYKFSIGTPENFTDNTRLNFTRYNDSGTSTGLYCRANNEGVCSQTGTYLAKTISNQVVSSDKVIIKNLEFYFDKTNQPYITVILTLEPKNYRGIKPSLKLQNTVTQRCSKASSACTEE